jgi:hypothetical protein
MSFETPDGGDHLTAIQFGIDLYFHEMSDDRRRGQPRISCYPRSKEAIITKRASVIKNILLTMK